MSLLTNYRKSAPTLAVTRIVPFIVGCSPPLRRAGQCPRHPCSLQARISLIVAKDPGSLAHQSSMRDCLSQHLPKFVPGEPLALRQIEIHSETRPLDPRVKQARSPPTWAAL